MEKEFQYIRSKIRDVQDFPKKGILFRDITPVLADATAFRSVIDALTQRYQDRSLTAILAIEARGFVFAAPLAYQLGLPLQMVRKIGKLPSATVEVSYDLEYGTNKLQLHRDALTAADQVLIVDDVLATGGTINAATKLATNLGAHVLECAFLLELVDLGGRNRLTSDVFSLLQL